MKSNILTISVGIISIVGLLLGLQYLIAAFQEPTCSPPGSCNVPPPLNTGSNTQIKTGSINLEYVDQNTASGLQIGSQLGNVKISTPTLDVNSYAETLSQATTEYNYQDSGNFEAFYNTPRCGCDTNNQAQECSSTFPATASDPAICYDQYYEPTPGGSVAVPDPERSWVYNKQSTTIPASVVTRPGNINLDGKLNVTGEIVQLPGLDNFSTITRQATFINKINLKNYDGTCATPSGSCTALLSQRSSPTQSLLAINPSSSFSKVTIDNLELAGLTTSRGSVLTSGGVTYVSGGNITLKNYLLLDGTISNQTTGARYPYTGELIAMYNHWGNDNSNGISFGATNFTGMYGVGKVIGVSTYVDQTSGWPETVDVQNAASDRAWLCPNGKFAVGVLLNSSNAPIGVVCSHL